MIGFSNLLTFHLNVIVTGLTPNSLSFFKYLLKQLESYLLLLRP